MKKNQTAIFSWVNTAIAVLFLPYSFNSYANEVQKFSPAKYIQYQPVIIKPHLSEFDLQKDNSPGLEKAYQTYLKTGKALNIITEGFVQFAYGAQQPIVPASPFELTVISLEPSESVTNVSSGDPMRWSYSLAYSGNKTRQAHIMVKPSQPNISTDLVITTDKRFYTLKLLSRPNGHYYREVKFWYPEDIQKLSSLTAHQEAENISKGDSPTSSDNNFDIEHLNFDYNIKSPFFGHSPQWFPTRVMDDGRQTFIQFPRSVAQHDLPALFIQTDKQMTLVNYRMKDTYFIIDRLFERAVLISGSGKNQQKLTITNQHWS